MTQQCSIPIDSSLLCAWCLSEQNIPAGEESHGICQKHANLFLLAYQEKKEDQSEVARVLGQIRQEHESAKRGLSGFASGHSKHAFLQARMDRIGELEQVLEQYVPADTAWMLIGNITNEQPTQGGEA